ncbi:DHH family protein [Clostridium omnivorum]|uniref:DHH family protein n=2 Tax=Clostridium omnivorum TaxID=1604902 RepID=A0ABQ5NBX7_9CLOT|nr:DHH family protein [Clostridium sp. E14]
MMINNDVIEAILNSKNIGISFHTSPDGDALGSALALMLALKKIGKNTYIVSRDEVPEIYRFLPYYECASKMIEKVQDDTDTVLILDCGNVARISGEVNFDNNSYKVINVDHHLSNDMYGALNYVDCKAAAVGEIVFDVINQLNITIDKDIAVCLYTALLTDTGGFKHSNTTIKTHSIAGELINLEIDFSEIHRKLFENKKLERVKLYSKIIDSMELYNNNKLCVMGITKDLLNSVGISEASDTSDIISIGMEIDTVEVAILVKETDAGTKISLRSKDKVDVRKIAETFGGGGHTKAAGLSIDKSYSEAKSMIINSVKGELH